MVDVNLRMLPRLPVAAAGSNVRNTNKWILLCINSDKLDEGGPLGSE